jgi:RecJ-like exonuclease
MTADDLAAYEWRVGGHGNCQILAIVDYDHDIDPVLGLMNTAVLAAAVVDEHNAAIREPQTNDDNTTLVPCGMCRGTGVDDQFACQWCDGTRTVLALGEWQRCGPELAPDQDAEDVEPTLGSQKGPAPG